MSSHDQVRYFNPRIIVLWLILFGILVLMNVHHVDSTLDARLYYSHSEALEFLQGLSSEASANYLRTECLDLFLILTYSTLLFYSLKYARVPSRRLWLAFVPGAFDLFETLNLLLSLAGRVSIFPALGIVTFFKWTTGLAVMGFFFWSRRKSTPSRS